MPAYLILYGYYAVDNCYIRYFMLKYESQELLHFEYYLRVMY